MHRLKVLFSLPKIFGTPAWLALVALPACADPCTDDGLLQDSVTDCAAAIAGTGTGAAQDTEQAMMDASGTADGSAGEASMGGSGGSGGSGSDESSSGPDGGDESSDGTTDPLWCPDNDGDGFGDPSACEPTDPDDAPRGWVPADNGEDCDDDNANAFPGAAELEGPGVCMQDADGDGWGDQDPPPGVNSGTDCADDNPFAFPGAAPLDDPTACMQDEDDDDFGDDTPPPGVDSGSDCDDANPAVTQCGTWCDDEDSDGFGDPDACVSQPVAPPGAVGNALDCDDGDANTFPGAAPADNPAACMNDDDDDDFGDPIVPPGVTPGSDCDDTNAQAFPGAAQIEDPTACMEDEDDDGYGDDSPPPGVTAGSDCDDSDPLSILCQQWCDDADTDGFGDPAACVVAPMQPAGTVGNNLDCDDGSAETFPGAAPADDPTACMLDLDGDDFGSDVPPPGVVAGTDCNDGAPFAFPAAAQIENPLACMEDEDGDGYGDETPPPGVTEGTDCDDTDPLVVSCTSFCDDTDGDGFGDPTACVAVPVQPAGTVANADDCDDGDPNTFPGAAPGDDPAACMTDADGDDFGDLDPAPGVVAGTDCDDADPVEFRCALLVTQDGTLDDPYDQVLVVALLGLSFTTIVPVQDNLAVLGDGDGMTLVVISETATSFQIGGTFRDSASPVVCLEGLVWDDMDMAAQAQVTGNDFMTILDDMSPLAGGFSSPPNVQVMQGPGSGVFYTTTGPNAMDIASRAADTDDIAYFAYESGVTMLNGLVAPSRRVGLGFDADQSGPTSATPTLEGATLFQAAAAWAID